MKLLFIGNYQNKITHYKGFAIMEKSVSTFKIGIVNKVVTTLA